MTSVRPKDRPINISSSRPPPGHGSALLDEALSQHAMKMDRIRTRTPRVSAKLPFGVARGTEAVSLRGLGGQRSVCLSLGPVMYEEGSAHLSYHVVLWLSSVLSLGLVMYGGYPFIIIILFCGCPVS